MDWNWCEGLFDYMFFFWFVSLLSCVRFCVILSLLGSISGLFFCYFCVESWSVGWFVFPLLLGGVFPLPLSVSLG